MIQRIAPDAAQRAAALDPTRSFIVQAPAGSGKTELLVRRILVLLATVDAPEELVALTFTLKAAAEMHQRVLTALADARNGSAADERAVLARAVVERDARAGWGLLDNPARLRIGTLDSFCADLVRRMPLSSRMGAVPRLLEDARELYAEAARATLALLDEGEPAQADAVARLLDHLDNDATQASALLAEMLAKRDQWLRLVAAPQPRADLEAALATLRNEALVQLAASCAPLAGELCRLASLAAAYLPADSRSALHHCRDLTRLPAAGDEMAEQIWLGCADLLLTGDKRGAWRQRWTANEGFPPQNALLNRAEKQRMSDAKAAVEALTRRCAAVDGLLEQLVAVRQLPAARYDEAQWSALAAIVDVLRLAASQLQLVFRARGACDFQALTHAALHGLNDPEGDGPSDLMLALDARIRHLLVDEFQDTSATQVELLEQLTQGWSEGDGRTLFIVGDPMQSIYRFREADVGLFLRTRQEGIGGLPLQPLQMATNFRSMEPVVRWVNGAFPQVLPAREDIASGAVGYARAEPWEADAPGAGVVVHALAGEPSATRAEEAARVLRIIRETRAALPSASIAILVRGRAHLAQIVPQLSTAGVSLRAVEIEPLAQRPAVVDAHALTRALLHPADRIAWLAVLRAPWCGLLLHDLHRLVSEAPREPVWSLLLDDVRLLELSDDGRGRALAAREALRPAIERMRRTGLRAQVEAAWLRLGGAETLRDPRDGEDVAAYFDLLDDVEAAGDLPRLSQLERALGQLYASGSAAAEDAVQVMTIHKAKGLEFDVVIVPGLERETPRDPGGLLAWTQRAREHGAGSELLMAALAARGGEADRLHAYIGRLEEQRAQHEAGRLLYVAATRARRTLHLIGAAHVDAQAAAREPIAGTLLARLWPAVRAEFDAAAQAARPSAVDAAPAGYVLDGTHWRLPHPRPLPATPEPICWAAVAAPPAVDALIEFSWAGEAVRHVGTVVHRWLQQVAEQPDQWNARRIQRGVPQFARELTALGVPPSAAVAAAARVSEALEHALQDERGRWILAPHAGARNELRLTGIDRGELVNVAIDRSFVADGVRWVIDYKTSVHEGSDREAFLDQERERYEAQLSRYARLVAGLGPEPVRCGLYFPLLRAWREWAA